MSDTGLILPGSLEFHIALQEIPPIPTWRAMADKTNGQMAIIPTLGGYGMSEAVTMDRFWEYLNDGEFAAYEEEAAELNAPLEGVIIGS